jgi:hypothetical protein
LRRSFPFALALIVLSLPAFARNPPKTKPHDPKPPVWDTRGIEEVDIAPAVHNGVPFVPVPWPGMSGAMLAKPAVPRMKALTTSTSSILARPRFGVKTNNIPSIISPQYSADASNAVEDENEPSLISIKRSGVDYTILSYQQTPVGGYYSLHFATSSNLTSSSATFTTSTVYVPSGYNQSFDSMLVENPYADGVRPGAVYMTGCEGSSSAPGTAIGNPMQIRTWASDNGGQTWTGGQTVVQTTATDPFILDKPVSDVSWFSGTRGYLYVAWVEAPNGTNAFRIRMRRNVNGLWQRCRPTGGICDTAWDAPITINDGHLNDGAAVPQVVVNPDNGNVYVFWMTVNGAIQMRRSTDAGVTFTPALAAEPITIVNGVNVIFGLNNTGYLLNGLRASVVPSIKWNTAEHNIMMAWHTRTAAEPTNETALYFRSFNPDTISAPLSIPIPFNDAAASQIQPALDNDDAGNVLVSYFTTQNSAGNYQLYGMTLSSAGVPLLGPTPLDSGTSANGYTGDYHEMFYWTFTDALASRWNTSWSRNSGNFDIMATGVK